LNRYPEQIEPKSGILPAANENNSFCGIYRRDAMDIYDYSEDNLSVIARSCSYSKYGQNGLHMSQNEDMSCSSCSYWNGRGCSKNHLESILSELQLD